LWLKGLGKTPTSSQSLLSLLSPFFRQQQRSDLRSAMATTTATTAMDEVAQLLVSVYDDYVSWADSGSTILQGLLRLLHDLTLSAAVSILDAERLRLRVMKGAMGSRHVAMTYEQFYEWLREVAGFVFDKFGESGPRALNLLLTKHLIPLAIKGKEVSVVSTVAAATAAAAARQPAPVVAAFPGRKQQQPPLPPSAPLDDATLSVLNPYGDFLYYWFTSRTVDEGTRLAPFKYLTYRVDHRHAAGPTAADALTAVAVESIFDTLQACRMLPDTRVENDLRFFAEMVQVAAAPRDIPGLTSGLSYLAFPGFLAIFENIAKQVQLTEVQTLGLGVTVGAKLKVLVQTVAERLLEGTLQRFVALEAEREAAALAAAQGKYSARHGSSRPGLPPASNRGATLSGTSVLWLARQAGLTQVTFPHPLTRLVARSSHGWFSVCRFLQVPGLSLGQLLDELLRLSDASQLLSDASALTSWEAAIAIDADPGRDKDKDKDRRGGPAGERKRPPRYGEPEGGPVVRVHAWAVATLPAALCLVRTPPSLPAPHSASPARFSPPHAPTPATAPPSMHM